MYPCAKAKELSDEELRLRGYRSWITMRAHINTCDSPECRALREELR